MAVTGVGGAKVLIELVLDILKPMFRGQPLCHVTHMVKRDAEDVMGKGMCPALFPT